MTGAVAQLPARLHAHFEAKAAQHGLGYPWWIPLGAMVSAIGFALVAVAQRGALIPPAPIALAAVLVMAPSLAQAVLPWWVPWWVELLAVLGGVGWLLSDPLPIQGPADVAPVVLAVLAAEMTSKEGGAVGLLASTASIGLLVATAAVGTLPGLLIYAGSVALGFDVGYMLRWQMRALSAERSKRETERTQAVLTERQRIAREIHDVVAHSLSVTLLHVTGARHVLNDGGDVAEAMDALTDAERVGRQAMADIRRTVSVLATEPQTPKPMPGVSDIAELVAGVRAAGLQVAFAIRGDLSGVGAAAGLSIYRITQESLANVAKHAPDAAVHLVLEATPDAMCLCVRNRLPRQESSGDDGGSGLGGMRARAKQLGGTIEVGPCGPDWVVRLSVPHRNTAPRPGMEDESPDCGIRRLWQ